MRSEISIRSILHQIFRDSRNIRQYKYYEIIKNIRGSSIVVVEQAVLQKQKHTHNSRTMKTWLCLVKVPRNATALDVTDIEKSDGLLGLQADCIEGV